MSFSTGPGSILSVVTGVLLVAMGTYIWFAAPRTRQNSALAAFTAGWGMIVVTGWILPHDDPLYFAFTIVTAGIFSPVVAISGLVLAWDFGGRDTPTLERRRLWWVAPLAFLPLPFSVVLGVPPADVQLVGWGDGTLARWAAGLLSVSWGVAAMVVLLMLAALRYPALAHVRPRAANSVLLLTFGLGAYLAVLYAPSSQLFYADGWRRTIEMAWNLIVLGTVLTLAFLWLRNIGKVPPPFAKRARWAAWTILAAMLASFAMPYWFGHWAEDVVAALEAMGVLTSVTRFLAVATFSYAILRNQLLGMDVKLRWTLSRSTIAAVFVAVFFIASEGAQLVFGQDNEVIGLFGAGLLVFAIAPLQRAAERLAEKAVPTVTGAGAGGTGSTVSSGAGADVVARESAYLNAVRLALRDRGLTREEELQLHELAEQLGIGAGRAHALLLGIEREGTSPVPTKSQEGNA